MNFEKTCEKSCKITLKQAKRSKNSQKRQTFFQGLLLRWKQILNIKEQMNIHMCSLENSLFLTKILF